MTRKSPTESATLYKIGTKKEGNDGNKWMVTEMSNGVKRWKLFKKPTKIGSKKTSSKKQSTKRQSTKRQSKNNLLKSNLKTQTK